MRSVVLSALVAAVLAQPDGPNHPLNPNPTDTSNRVLVGKAFPYNQIPYQADTSQPRIANDPTWRGEQSGYNKCNSTTEGPNSMCQTLIVNSIDDFCVWGGAAPNSVVGDVEGEMVIWCTKPGRGGRVIPPGALKAVQFIRTPSYVEVTGHIDQTMINIKGDDEGGELDSGGQDERGNPIGALAYSTSMGSSHGVPTQSRTWHAFMGSNIFCQKLCDPKAPNAAGICRHTLDTLGCDINIPAAYEENVFSSCLGDDQLPPQPGLTQTPVSRSCTTYESTILYPASGAAPTATASSSSVTSAPASPTPSAPSTTRSSSSTRGTPIPPASAPSSTPTSGSDASQNGSGDNAAVSLRSSGSFAILVSALALVAGAIVV